MASGHREIEIKLRLGNADQGRRLLRRTGFRVLRRRVFESNTVYDTLDLALRRRGCLVRLRRAGRLITLTFKGPSTSARHKSREELDCQVPDFEIFNRIFTEIGLRPVFRYEKFRTEYSRPGSTGIATLDQTPIGDFLELEGAPAWIDRTARDLGFHDESYITESYASLYLEYRRGRASAGPHMVFGEVNR